MQESTQRRFSEKSFQCCQVQRVPVASSAVMQTTFAELSAAYGGKVTLVRHDIRSQRGSGQEEKEALSVTSGDHMCAPFR
jgi:hypothetical protein